MILNNTEISKISELLINKKIGVLPTDTIYGVHCKALDQELVDRVYEIKERPSEMPLIIAISDIQDLLMFGVEIGDFEKEQIDKFWPGPNTLIFKTTNGSKRAFRIPNDSFLQSLLKITGPLISTSANIHAKPAAKDISEAMSYFGNKIDFYVDGGRLENPASSIYDISTKDQIIKIR